MDTFIESHVETNKNDLLGTELDGRIQTLKAAVAAITNYRGLFRLEFVVMLIKPQPFDIEVPTNGSVVGQSEAIEFRKTFFGSPPGAVASVDNVSPRCEAVRLVDCEDLRAATRNLQVRSAR